MHEISREEPAIPQITYRKACVLQLFFILSVVLWGCTVPQSVPDPPVVEVAFVALTANWEHYVTLADTFNAQHPGVHVHVIDPASIKAAAPGDEVQQAVRVADALLLPEVDLARASNSGIFRDLTTLAQHDGDLASHNVYPNLLSRFQEHGGATWGIPLGVSPLLLAYDRARFDAAGVSYPEPGWSWDQFLATAQQLSDPAQAQWGFAGFTPGSFDLAAFILQHGGTLVEDGRPALDTPRNAEALAWVADLARVHRVMPPESAAPMAPQIREAAMWLQRPGGSLRTTTGLAPLPEGARYAALDIVYGGYISAGSQVPEAAWQWLLYLTHQPPPHELLPARPSVLESTVDPSDAGYAAYPYALERVAPEPWHRLRDFSPAWSWLADEGLAALLAGSAAAPDVLHDAQSLALEGPAAPPMGGLPTGAAGPPPTVARPPRADPTSLRTLVFDRYAFEEVARHYVASLDTPTSITVESFASGVTYPPEKRAEFDVFAAPPNFRAEEVAGHWLTLDPFIESDGAFDLDDFYSRALDTYTRDGKLWALPTDLDTLLLFYNPAAFDVAGLPYPDGTSTWEDLAAAAEQLSTGENRERRWGLVTPMTGWESLPLIRAAQQIGRAGPLVDDPEHPRAPTLDREAVVEGVRWYAALTRDRQVLAPPALYYRDWLASDDLIASGRAAMWISTVGVGLRLPGASDGIGVAPLPVTGSPYTTMGVTGYGISAHSAQPEAAWQWLVHLTRQPALGRGLPARRSLLDEAVFPFFPDALQPDLRQAFQTTLETYENSGFSAARAGTPWYDVAYRLYRLAVRETLEIGTDPAVTLGAAQATAEAYMACLHRQALLASNEGSRDLNALPPEITAACEEAAAVPPEVLWYED